jgi:hypothetical protein
MPRKKKSTGGFRILERMSSAFIRQKGPGKWSLSKINSCSLKHELYFVYFTSMQMSSCDSISALEMIHPGRVFWHDGYCEFS